MGRSLDEIVGELPRERQGRVRSRHRELSREVEGLRELRRLAGKAQAQIASSMNIRQPSVSKIEQQADMYLSTLRSYVEAVGGTLDLVVSLPDHAPIHVRSLGEASNGGGSELPG
jgi:hypothetical protein